MMLEQIKEASDFIRQRIETFQPQVGIILGTGLGALANEIKTEFVIAYDEIPNFPVSTVESHKGKLLFGKLGNQSVVCMQGRFHFYEGYAMQQVTFPVRVMKMLGITRLFVSNAAGSLNSSYQIADLMLIQDHISLFLPSPLTGPNLMGERFPDMSEPYDPMMIEKAEGIAFLNNIRVQRGTYVSVPGPQLETKAEYRMLRMLGADAVGMSTVPEIIVARQMDMTCFGISVITDMCIPEALEKANLDKIIAAAMKAEPAMTLVLKELISQL